MISPPSSDTVSQLLDLSLADGASVALITRLQSLDQSLRQACLPDRREVLVRLMEQADSTEGSQADRVARYNFARLWGARPMPVAAGDPLARHPAAWCEVSEYRDTEPPSGLILELIRPGVLGQRGVVLRPAGVAVSTVAQPRPNPTQPAAGEAGPIASRSLAGAARDAAVALTAAGGESETVRSRLEQLERAESDSVGPGMRAFLAAIGLINSLDQLLAGGARPELEQARSALLQQLERHGVREAPIRTGDPFDRYPPELYVVRRVDAPGARPGEVLRVARRAFRGPDGRLLQQATLDVNLAE